MSNHSTDWPWRVAPDELYHVLIDTRNLEVNLFWQRTNYFLVLSSGILLAFFTVKDVISLRTFAITGLLTSVLWCRTCLASKYWQTFWEQQLENFEVKWLPNLHFFQMDPEKRHLLVEDGLNREGMSLISRTAYRMATKCRSVSFAMLLLAVVFVLGWLALLANSFVNPPHP